MNNVAEMEVARNALNGPIASTNLYILSHSGTWQGPFESMEHIEEDATIGGHVVSVSVTARPLGKFMAGEPWETYDSCKRGSAR